MRRRILPLLMAIILAMATALPGLSEEEPVFAELGEIDLPIDEVEPTEADPDPVSDEYTEAAPAPEDAPAQSALPALLDGVTLGVGEKLPLGMAEGVSYASSKPKVADVDAGGVLTAKKRGSARITRFVEGEPSGVCAVTVMRAPSRVILPAKTAVVNAGDVLCLTGSVPKGYAGTITYSSDDPGIMTVDDAGNVRGVTAGSATLTATAYNGKFAQCAVRVLAGAAPARLVLGETDLHLPVKGSFQLVADVGKGAEAVFDYATSKKSVAAVSESGLITAKKIGHATVTVTTHNGLTASCAVTVYNPPKRVTLNRDRLALNLDEGFRLTATLPRNTWARLTWSSSDEAVAAVDAEGLVAAVGKGTATITVTTDNGKTAECAVIVRDPANEPYVTRGEPILFEERDTLKVSIYNDNGIYLAYIWVKDANRQLYKWYGPTDKPAGLLQDAVAANHLEGRLAVGFNASPPVNEKYRSDWNRDPNYHNREPSPLMIANGQVLVNDPEKLIKEKQLFWIDGDNRLCASEKEINDMTVDERRALYQQIIDSGARNTMIWRPVLWDNYRATELSAAFRKRHSAAQRHQALGQIDDHTFLLISSAIGREMNFPRFQEYLEGLGCRFVVEFDAGASSTMLFKSADSAAVQRVAGGNRPMTMVMYFTEQVP